MNRFNLEELQKLSSNTEVLLANVERIGVEYGYPPETSKRGNFSLVSRKSARTLGEIYSLEEFLLYSKSLKWFKHMKKEFFMSIYSSPLTKLYNKFKDSKLSLRSINDYLFVLLWNGYTLPTFSDTVVESKILIGMDLSRAIELKNKNISNAQRNISNSLDSRRMKTGIALLNSINCKKSRFSRVYLYVTNSFIKVGCTSNPSRRLGILSKSLGDYEEVFVSDKLLSEEAYSLERTILMSFSSDRAHTDSRFCGSTEVLGIKCKKDLFNLYVQRLSFLGVDYKHSRNICR